MDFCNLIDFVVTSVCWIEHNFRLYYANLRNGTYKHLLICYFLTYDL